MSKALTDLETTYEDPEKLAKTPKSWRRPRNSGLIVT